MNRYLGNDAQIRGAEHYTLHGGKGEGMDFLYVRNGLGLEAWISLDRAGDIARLSYKGANMGFFGPCGHVGSKYYDDKGIGFLKSMSGGFLVTCGLTNVGAPCTDNGEELPQHGTLSNLPARLLAAEETKEGLRVALEINDSALFGKKLVMKREYIFSYTENKFTVTDTVTNNGDTESPYMILYHCNMGYPLLSETSKVVIPNYSFVPRDEEAAKYPDDALIMEKPQDNFAERCYFYDVKENGGKSSVGIFNDGVGGMVMKYNKSDLPCFTEWKMMGKHDYVLGIEPGNCTPLGREKMREQGILRFLSPDESKSTAVEFSFTDTESEFDNKF